MNGETNYTQDKPIIFFDGVCNLCESSVLFIIKRDKKKVFLFSQLQSALAKKMISHDKEELKSVVLLENNKTYSQSTAALRIARQLTGWTKLLWVFIIVPKPIRDMMYNFIANNRYKWFGKKDECLIPTPELKSRFI